MLTWPGEGRTSRRAACWLDAPARASRSPAQRAPGRRPLLLRSARLARPAVPRRSSLAAKLGGCSRIRAAKIEMQAALYVVCALFSPLSHPSSSVCAS